MNDYEKNDREEDLKKRRYLTIGVIIFSIIILVLWAANMRSSFIRSSEIDNKKPSIIKSFTADLKDAMDLSSQDHLTEDIGIDHLEPEAKLSLDKVDEDLTVETEKGIMDTGEQLIADLKIRLLKNDQKHCPEYINCMPKLGAETVADCIIPPGCEDLTQITY